MKQVEIRARSYSSNCLYLTVINLDDSHDTYTVLISDNQEVAAHIPKLGYLIRHNDWLNDAQKQHVKEFINQDEPVIREVGYPVIADLVKFAHNGMPGEEILELFYGKDWKKSEFGKRKGVKKKEEFVSKFPMDLSAWND